MGHDRLIQYAVLGATAFAAVMLTVVQTRLDRTVFVRYLGGTDPVAAMLVVSVLAFASLAYLRSAGSFQILGEGSLLDGLRFTAAVTPLFALVAVVADLVLRCRSRTLSSSTRRSASWWRCAYTLCHLLCWLPSSPDPAFGPIARSGYWPSWLF